MSIAVCNSSPLIGFATIDQLRLLEVLFSSILIPSAVAQEIERAIPILPSWMDIQQVTLPLPKIVLRPSLGSGEREAIALALGLLLERSYSTI